MDDETTEKISNTQQGATSERTRSNSSVGIPYMNGISEKLCRTFEKHGATLHHIPTNTIRAALVRHKDKWDPQNQCGVLYKVQCRDCSQTYIRETGRALSTRMEEHWENVSILA